MHSHEGVGLVEIDLVVQRGQLTAVVGAVSRGTCNERRAGSHARYFCAGRLRENNSAARVAGGGSTHGCAHVFAGAGGCSSFMRRVGGSAAVYGRIAYVGQSAFIINASLRENVLFGSEYNEER